MTRQAARGGNRMTLMCYTDIHGYGWRHVDLFVHDAQGHELNWVHWQVPADGPDAADRTTAEVEPLLRRISAWRHDVSASGMDYWTADVAWEEA
ncbi:hypothetical protein [Streptomyces sp. S.PB5]|uniref:hypothetical protein n=1 Tax=Streptomyces sp. S.PB5 TaxID=3020844 RepID=UPI0025AFB9F2|nr:hypothetical protein [Streptomyces sp. S.PB5]MDN3028097.1 hypothetical protein [Streptomyces sp. S.PB5]